MAQVPILPIQTYQGPALDIGGNFARGQQAGILRQANQREQQEFEQKAKDREAMQGILSKTGGNYEKAANMLLQSGNVDAATKLLQMETQKRQGRVSDLQARAAEIDIESAEYKQGLERQYEQIATETSMANNLIGQIQGIEDPEQAGTVINKYIKNIDKINEQRKEQGLQPIEVPQELKSGDVMERIALVSELAELGNMRLDQLNRARAMVENPEAFANQEKPSPQTDLGKLKADLEAGYITKDQYAEQMKTGGVDMSEIAESEQKLRKEYNADPVVQDFKEIDQAYDKIRSTKATPAGDLGLIFNIMKMFDPGSTVREGEFANAQNSAGVPGRVRAMYNNVIEGTRLTEEQRNDFKNTARGIYSTSVENYNETTNKYRELADEYGFKPDRIGKIAEFEEAPEFTEQNPATPQTEEEFSALPPGSVYKDPEDGQLYRKE